MRRRGSRVSRWRWLALLPLPLLWAFLAHEGELQFLENKLLDLRFRFRGELAAPVNLVYVDVDTPAIELIGERPFNRAIYANVAEALLTAGGARVVAFDFVFSRISTSGLVDQNRARAGNSELRRSSSPTRLRSCSRRNTRPVAPSSSRESNRGKYR